MPRARARLRGRTVSLGLGGVPRDFHLDVRVVPERRLEVRPVEVQGEGQELHEAATEPRGFVHEAKQVVPESGAQGLVGPSVRADQARVRG